MCGNFISFNVLEEFLLIFLNMILYMEFYLKTTSFRWYSGIITDNILLSYIINILSYIKEYSRDYVLQRN